VLVSNALTIGYPIFLNYSIQKNWFWCLGLDLNPSKDDIASIWPNLALFIGAFLFLHISMTIVCRMAFNRPVPYQGAEPRAIMVLNRVIGNTIEHGIVFACLLFAAINQNPLNWSNI
jgi:hypothetical protein